MPKATRDLTTVYTGLTASDFDKFTSLAAAKGLTRSELAREAIKYYLAWQEQVHGQEGSAQIIQLLQKMNQSIDSIAQPTGSDDYFEGLDPEESQEDPTAFRSALPEENPLEVSQTGVHDNAGQLDQLTQKIESILLNLEERIELESLAERESTRRLEQKFSALDMLINRLFVALGQPVSDRTEDVTARMQLIGSKLLEKVSASQEVFTQKIAQYRQEDREDYQVLAQSISRLNALFEELPEQVGSKSMPVLAQISEFREQLRSVEAGIAEQMSTGLGSLSERIEQQCSAVEEVLRDTRAKGEALSERPAEMVGSQEQWADLESRLTGQLSKIGADLSQGELRVSNMQEQFVELERFVDGLLPKIAVEISLLHYVLWRNHPGEKEQKDQVFDLAQSKARQRVGRWLEELRGRADSNWSHSESY